ncbi:MAG: hypothetical protein PHX30_03340 [Candidatus Pacebacteria bacterium]|nr:hypothetical protein [Candidatus Paceibacterota bacterium]
MSKYNLKTILPIFLSFLFVLGYSFFLQASDPSKVQFTSDTIASLTGISDGDLYIAQNSECDSIDISDSTLTANSIPAGSSFILKTTKHNNALKITSSNDPTTLIFSSNNLIAGDIASWTLSSSSASGAANIIWGVPSADTRYTVKVNGLAIKSLFSDTSSEITFVYSENLTSTRTFTLELDTGGTPFIAPSKPNISNTEITASDDETLNIQNLPSNITQIAISRTPDFADVSWRDFEEEKFVTIGDTTEILYVKFRTNQGAVSDVIIYTPKAASLTLNDGDIVKNPNSPDVYVIKYKNNKQYKRLILSPSVFNSYGHLKWEDLKTISQEQLGQFTTSNLVKETLDTIIYQLFPNGDTGERKHLDTSTSYDTDSVYEINAVDRDSYKLMQ